MAKTILDFELRLISPSFDSPLTDILMELNHLRRLQLAGSTAPWMFFQLKEIFHILESVGSARIEGNRTTISEYIERKIASRERSSERFSEIANVEKAMAFIEQTIFEGSEITHHFIRELHHLAVAGLHGEGDKTPGAYRTWEVEISQSKHIPPAPYCVQTYMDELLSFINAVQPEKYDLLKTALAHHRFAWIHPFGNGNGRVVRLLTYALLIKYGFNVKDGKLLNPTAVFCNDRDRYYQMLAQADQGGDTSLLAWCEYVLDGVLSEITKVDKLLDFDYLHKRILLPAIERGVDRGYLNKLEGSILKVGIRKQQFKATDLGEVMGGLTARQRTHQIAKMREAGFICPFRENGRTYFVSFINNYLMRNLIEILEQENFIPPIDS